MEGIIAQQGKIVFEVCGMLGDTTKHKAFRRGTVSLRARVSAESSRFVGVPSFFPERKLQLFCDLEQITFWYYFKFLLGTQTKPRYLSSAYSYVRAHA